MNKRNIIVKRMGLALLGLLILLLVISSLLFLVDYIVGSYSNGSVILGETIPSPDGKYKAYILSVDFGATTAKTRQLVIQKNYIKYTPLMRGNIYVVDGAYSVKWESNDKLIVTIYSTYHKPYKQKNEYNGIEIEYKYFMN